MAAASQEKQNIKHGDRSKLGFRQFFDRNTCTYTYLLWDKESKDAVLIDPVDTLVDRDLQFIVEIGELKLLYCVNTHLHADHITGSGLIKEKWEQLTKDNNYSESSKVQSVIGNFKPNNEEKDNNEAKKADVLLNDKNNTVQFGQFTLIAVHTPGHTENHVCYYLSDKSMVFTGDALLIRGCGRCDFQGGSAEVLWNSVTGRSKDSKDNNSIVNENGLFVLLPKDCVVYPGHDYHGRLYSSIGEEMNFNPRLKQSNTFDEFSKIMVELHERLSKPGKMDVCVPANRRCGYETELNPKKQGN